MHPDVSALREATAGDLLTRIGVDMLGGFSNNQSQPVLKNIDL